MKPFRHLGAFSIFVSLSLPLAAQSTWNGTTSTNWSNPANWSPGAPAVLENITIADTTANSTLTLDDGSHAVGAIVIGTTGTRTSAFAVNTTTANTLTIGGGVTANGAFNGTSLIGTRLRGKIIIPADQIWQVAGEPGSSAADRGLAINEVSGSGAAGTFVLNGILTKAGVGQLTLGATNVSGASDIVVNDGSLKLNAGGSLPLTLGGTGGLVINNAATLLISQNSGSFNVTRPIRFNLTSGVETGSGSNNKTGTYEIASNMEWNGVHTITNSKDANNSASGFINFNFSGVMSGSGNITKTGASQLAFTGTAANTLTGQVTVSGGTLRLDKTGVSAVPGNILVTGGTLNIAQSGQIGSGSTLTLTGGTIAASSGRTQTLAALNISTPVVAPSVSGFIVTGSTSITSGTAELNSGQIFTTNSLTISNGSTLRAVGNATAPASSTINVGSGGLILGGSRILFGNAGNASTIQFNLGGDVVSTGTSQFTVSNYNGPRIIDLQAGARSFAVNDGTLDIRTTVQNGTLVKSGAGALILSRAGSTADFSFAGGPVQVTTQATAGNVSQSGGSILMDIGGATPPKITTTGNFTTTGGSIDLTAFNGSVTAPATLELVRYGGNLVGTPVINIPPQVRSSRLNPVLDYGTGSNGAITLALTAVPQSLVWHGAAADGLWDYNNTANFNAGSGKFYSLDSVTFDDAGANPQVRLDSEVFPGSVVFNHGVLPTYLVTGAGGIGGTAKITKNGTGTTIIATDNNHTGGTEVLAGTLAVGNGGSSGNLGAGPVLVDAGATLAFARDGSASFANVFTGTGTISNTGPGTAALTANSPLFAGTVTVAAGTLQFGDGGPDGSLGTANIDVLAGATFGIKRGGALTISNLISGAGAVTVAGGGSVILSSANSHTGGVTVTDGAHLRVSSDTAYGALPVNPTPNAIRLNMGGLKNQDSDTVVDAYRGVSIANEAYFTAGWSKSLSIGGPITGSGNIFVNYDSGLVVFADATSDWNGVLTLGASKSGFTGTTGGILEISAINNGGTAGPLGTASADPANLVFNGGRINYTGGDATCDRGATLQTSGTIDVPFAKLTLTGTITGPGSLTKTGAGTLVLTGTSDFSGEKVINNGTLVVGSASALGTTASTARFTGTTGILDLATDTGIPPYPFTIGAGNSGTILSNVATAGSPGITHTFGDAALSTVTLNVGAGSNVTGGDPRVAFPNLSLSAGSAGNTTLNPTTAAVTVGNVSIASGNYAKTLILGGTGRNNLITGTIGDGINILTLRKENDSLWTLSGDSSFTGNVAVDDGVLEITRGNALGGSNKILYVAGGADAGRVPELRLSGGISLSVAELQISGAGEGNLTGALRNVSGDNTLTATTQVTMRTGNGGTTLWSDGGTLTINSPLVTTNATGRTLVLAGPGNGVINGVVANGTTANLPVTKTGAGTWTLIGAHTYSGATTVNGGTLSLGQAALDDAAAVGIAAGATLNLDFTGIDRVGSLTINGVSKPDGVYDATTDPGFITGTGSIRVGPELSGYGIWTAAYPFAAGVNDGPADDPDGDGINNLLEYVLGGIPVGGGAADTAILPAVVPTGDALVLTFKRSDSSETDVALKVQWSDDLSTWHDFVTVGPADALPQVDVTEDLPSPGLDTVVVTIPKTTAPGGRIFARVRVVK